MGIINWLFKREEKIEDTTFKKEYYPFLVEFDNYLLNNNNLKEESFNFISDNFFVFQAIFKTACISECSILYNSERKEHNMEVLNHLSKEGKFKEMHNPNGVKDLFDFVRQCNFNESNFVTSEHDEYYLFNNYVLTQEEFKNIINNDLFLYSLCNIIGNGFPILDKQKTGFHINKSERICLTNYLGGFESIEEFCFFLDVDYKTVRRIVKKHISFSKCEFFMTVEDREWNRQRNIIIEKESNQRRTLESEGYSRSYIDNYIDNQRRSDTSDNWYSDNNSNDSSSYNSCNNSSSSYSSGYCGGYDSGSSYD